MLNEYIETIIHKCMFINKFYLGELRGDIVKKWQVIVTLNDQETNCYQI